MRGPWLVALALLPLAGCLSEGDPNTADLPLDADAAGAPDASPAAANLSAVALLVELSGVYPANPAFAPNALSVAAGSLVSLTFRNTDANPLGKHDWTLEGVEGAHTEVIPVGEEQTVAFAAPARGTYAFFCAVPGHRTMGVAGGMQGTFVVA